MCGVSYTYEPPSLCGNVSIRLSLSLSLSSSQDNFAFSEEYETAHGVYEAIQDVMNNHVVTHENDRTWRNAVVTNKPSLLALR